MREHVKEELGFAPENCQKEDLSKKVEELLDIKKMIDVFLSQVPSYVLNSPEGGKLYESALELMDSLEQKAGIIKRDIDPPKSQDHI